MSRLMNYDTGEYVRQATPEEEAESIDRNVFCIDDCGYVLREDESTPKDLRVYVEDEKEGK